MSYSVIYSTHTDNVIKLASQIELSLGKDGLLFDGRVESAPDFAKKDADVVFVGFWTTKNSADPKTSELLASLKGKKVALFGTCGFGSDEAHFTVVKNNVLKLVDPSCTVVGFFICNGRIGYEFVAKAKEANGDPKVDYHFPSYLKFYKEDEGHPNSEDLAKVASWAKETYKKA